MAHLGATWKWWPVLAVILVGCGVLVCLQFEWPPGAEVAVPDLGGAAAETPLGRTRMSAEEVSELLMLGAEAPESVEGLKAESMLICEGLAADLPSRPETHAAIALTYKRFGSSAQAVECWERSLECNPRFSPAYFGLASVAAQKAEYEEAAGLLRKTILLNPGLWGAHNLLAEVLLDQGKAEEALEVALAQRALFPDSHEGHFWLGQAYLQLRDYENARRSHERVLALAEDFSLSHHSLAVICVRLSEAEKAKEHRREFARLKETDLQEDRGRNRHFRDLAYQRWTAASTLFRAGNVHLAVGSVRKAEAYWLRASAVAREDISSREALAALYEGQKPALGCAGRARGAFVHRAGECPAE